MQQISKKLYFTMNLHSSKFIPVTNLDIPSPKLYIYSLQPEFMKARNKLFWKAFSLGVLFFISAFKGCDIHDDEPPNPSTKTTIQYGSSVSLGKGGTVRTWIESARDGKPVSIGIDVSSKTLTVENLPKQQVMYHLQFPKKELFAPFVGMMFDWNPEGHIPMELYEKPHFDIHFYMVPEEEHMSIPLGINYQHAPWFEKNYMPADYMSLYLAIPGMGNHWIHKDAPELGPAGFSETLILGAYEDKQIFIEPMITLEYLQQLKPDQTVVEPISQFPHVQKSGYYPRKYIITNDAKAGVYKIALTDLYFREAN